MCLKILLVAALLAAISATGSAAEAGACPVAESDTEKAGSYIDAVTAAVRSAPDCDWALRTFEECQLGSSAGNALASVVRAKCELLFMNKASAAVKKAYKKAQRRCDRIAERHSGTMYQSFAAVCSARAARDFARRY